MKRRSFVAVFAALAALPPAALGAMKASRAPAEEMELVQYGEIVHFRDERRRVMPAYVKNVLDRRSFEVSQKIGRPIKTREYRWFPAGYRDRADPLGQRAVGAIKFFIEEPRAWHDARVSAEISGGRWVPFEQVPHVRPAVGMRVELADFRLGGRTARYGRIVENA